MRRAMLLALIQGYKYSLDFRDLKVLTDRELFNLAKKIIKEDAHARTGSV